MKKPYVELTFVVQIFTEDIVCTSNGNFYENEQPDFDYFNQTWEGGK